MAKIVDPKTGFVPAQTKYKIFSIEMAPATDDVNELLSHSVAVALNAENQVQVMKGGVPTATQALWVETAKRFEQMQATLNDQAKQLKELKEKLSGKNLTNPLATH